MNYNMGKDYIRITALSLLLTASGVGGNYLFRKEMYFSLLFIVLIVILVIRIFINDRKSLISDLIRLTDSLRFNDFTLYYKKKNGSRLHNELVDNLNDAVSVFREESRKNYSRRNLYYTMLSVIDSGIIVFNSKDEAEWINDNARSELMLPKIRVIDDLAIVSPELPAIIRNLSSGETFLYKFHIDGTPKELALSTTRFISEKENYLLLSLKNIHSVLEKEEMIAWQKLIRVLTHEIMNSITPVISLSETLTERTAEAETNDKDFDNMRTALSVIHRRSKGLLTFVENYRKLSRLPQPSFSPVNIPSMLGDICSLHNNVKLSLDIPQNTTIDIDRSQIEQVMINLIKNGREADTENANPEIRVSAYFEKENIIRSGYSGRRIFIKVSDNGKGISPEAADKVFLPFFTTKSSGSGIGLSLCKQIITMHGGKIGFTTEKDKGTDFVISLKV